MNPTRQRLVSVFFLCASLLTACRPSPHKPPAHSSDVPNTYENIDPSGQEIVFWHPYTGIRQAVLMEMVAEFNTTNPWGIQLEAEAFESEYHIFKRALSGLNTEDIPDLLVAYSDQAAVYHQAGAIVDLTGLVESVKWGLTAADRQDFFIISDSRQNSPRLGFPLSHALFLLSYNADWLAELNGAGILPFDGPPVTPEDFTTAACAAVARPFSRGPGEGIGYAFDPGSASQLTAWVFAFGGDVFDYSANRFTFDDPPTVEAVTFIHHLFTTRCARAVETQYDDQADFGRGRLLFTTASSAGLPYYTQSVAEGAGFTWHVAAIPHTNQSPVVNQYAASASILKTTPERELAAWLFLKYFTSAAPQARWAAVSDALPVRASAASGLSAYFSTHPAYRTAFELLENSRSEPPVPGYDTVRRKVGEAMAAILAGAPIEPTLEQLTQDANAILSDHLTGASAPPP